MEKVILIDKPQEFTSFDVVAKLRGIIKIKRIGHTGTLDPMATGVLVCLCGKATKLAERLPIQEKRYTAKLRLGIITDTLDITGTVTQTRESNVTREQFEIAAAKFVGNIMQVPPMYSAIQINGQRLYDLARKGVEVERTARPIIIYHLNVLDFDPVEQTAEIDVLCSKGSYIRSLALDIGESLGVGATLTDLCRTEAGGYNLSQCHSFAELQQLAEENRLEEVLLPTESLFSHLPRITTGEWQKKMIANGVPLMLDKLRNPQVGQYTLWCNEEFLGVFEVLEDADTIKMIYKE